MKIEFLDDINTSGQFPDADPNQLIRLYDFDSQQADRLRQTIQELVIENNKDLELTSLGFIQSVNCSLVLQISDTDKGIMTSDKKKFVCNLTVAKYKEMVLLMKSFSEKETTGYQWLYDLDTPIDFLFSPGGTW